MRFKAIPAVYLFLTQGQKILLTRRCNTGYMDGSYMVPSGHVEAGESPMAAMIREAKEEIGIDILQKDLEFVQLLYRQKKDETGERVDIFFKCSTWDGEIKNMEPEKCDDISFFLYQDFPENMVEYIKTVLDSYFSGKFYSEL